MKVENMTSRNGNAIPNQFIINDGDTLYFQSYTSIIAKHSDKLYLDEKYWNYSVTTSKYRNKFTGLSTRETEDKIKSGEIILVDLN